MVLLREVRDSDKEIYKIGTPDLNRTKREGTPKKGILSPSEALFDHFGATLLHRLLSMVKG